MGLLRYEMLLPGFALVLARIAGLMLAVPMFSSSQLPRPIKIGFVLSLALMVFPAVSPSLPSSLTLGQAAAGILGEFVIGEVIGLGAGLIFFGAQFAGKMISHQTGMALGAVFNPVFDAESTVLDQIWFFTALLFFLALHGHLAVVEVVLGSFEKVPPLTLWPGGLTAEFFASILQSIFEMAVRLATPTILALSLTLLSLGVLMKTMPQFNILSVGFSLKIVIGIFIMSVTIGVSDGVMTDALAEGLDHVGLWLDEVSEGVIHAG